MRAGRASTPGRPGDSATRLGSTWGRPWWVPRGSVAPAAPTEMSRSARKATARRIWLTARLILATRGAGQRALNSPRRRRIRERPGRGARQREDEQAEAHPYGLAHPAHQAERDCRRRSEAERGERDHIAALEGAEARRAQERGEPDRGGEA